MEATWSNWWGSAELYAEVVRRLEAELCPDGGECRTKVVLNYGDAELDYATPAEFSAAPTEALRRLRELTADCSGPGGTASFTLSHRRSPLKEDEAKLVAECSDTERERRTLLRVLPLVELGYAPYWGSSDVSSDLRAPRFSRHLSLLRPIVNALGSFLLGVVLFAISRRYDLPGLAPAAFVGGALVPAAINAIVPRVQIAPYADVRMRKILTRIQAALVSAALAWLAHLLLGG